MGRGSPIRRKLISIILLTSSAVLLLTCASFFAYEYFTFRQTTAANLSTLGAVLASNTTGSLTFNIPEDATEVLSALQAEPHIRAACLYDEKGPVFATYPKDAGVLEFPPTP